MPTPLIPTTDPPTCARCGRLLTSPAVIGRNGLYTWHRDLSNWTTCRAKKAAKPRPARPPREQQ
jgi:hypothetical protein